VKRDFAASLEGLEEDAAIFTGLMLKVKQAFEKGKRMSSLRHHTPCGKSSRRKSPL